MNVVLTVGSAGRRAAAGGGCHGDDTWNVLEVFSDGLGKISPGVSYGVSDDDDDDDDDDDVCVWREREAEKKKILRDTFCC